MMIIDECTKHLQFLIAKLPATSTSFSEIVKERTLTEACRKEMIKLIDKDFLKYRAQGIVEKMITAVMEISQYRKTVRSYVSFMAHSHLSQTICTSSVSIVHRKLFSVYG